MNYVDGNLYACHTDHLYVLASNQNCALAMTNTTDVIDTYIYMQEATLKSLYYIY